MKLNVPVEVCVYSNDYRVIIPTHLPTNVVKALDVSTLDQDQRDNLAIMTSEYSEYVDRIFSSMYTFEEWIEQSHPDFNVSDIKWVSFEQNTLS